MEGPWRGRSLAAAWRRAGRGDRSAPLVLRRNRGISNDLQESAMTGRGGRAERGRPRVKSTGRYRRAASRPSLGCCTAENGFVLPLPQPALHFFDLVIKSSPACFARACTAESATICKQQKLIAPGNKIFFVCLAHSSIRIKKRASKSFYWNSGQHLVRIPVAAVGWLSGRSKAQVACPPEFLLVERIMVGTSAPRP